MDDCIDALLSLKQRDPQLTLFGASRHRYELNPALAESELAALEARYGCVFPEDYRAFIGRIGNGGAGPNYGIFPIGMHSDGSTLTSWDSGGLVGDLSQPFQYTDAWNLPVAFWATEPKCPEGTPLGEEERIWCEWEQQRDAAYWAPSVMNGAIPLTNEGCGRLTWLVVTGPLAGSVWSDHRSDNNGLIPSRDGDGKPLAFEAWYRQWLRDAAAQLANHAPCTALGSIAKGAQGKMRPWYTRWYGLTAIVVIALLALMALRGHSMEPFRMRSTSMAPTLTPDDVVIIDKSGFANKTIWPIDFGERKTNAGAQRGDIIGFFRRAEGKLFLMRVVGVAGDTVTYRDSRLFINGADTRGRQLEDYFDQHALRYFPRFKEQAGPIEYSVLIKADDARPEPAFNVNAEPGHCKGGGTTIECKVPPGHYFVLSDNRDSNVDSRYLGFVAEADIVGKVIHVFPLNT